MKDKMLVVADLGRLKAYWLEDDVAFSHPRLELIEDWTSDVTHHLSEELTDQAGQFRKGTSGTEGPSALSDGEQHNLDLERRRRAIKSLAQQISELIERNKVNEVYFAADRRIN